MHLWESALFARSESIHSEVHPSGRDYSARGRHYWAYYLIGMPSRYLISFVWRDAKNRWWQVPLGLLAVMKTRWELCPRLYVIYRGSSPRGWILHVLMHPWVASGGMADDLWLIVAIYPLELEGLCHSMMLSVGHKIPGHLMMQSAVLKTGLTLRHQVSVTVVSCAELCPHQWIRHRPLKVSILIDYR